MKNITVIKTLDEIASRYDGIIMGLSGVLYDSDGKVYISAIRTVENLHQKGKKVVFLANTSRRAKDIAFKLERLGIHRDIYDGVLTSGEILFHDLKARSDNFFSELGRKYYYIGNNRNRLIFEMAGYEWVSSLSEADFIIVGDVTDKDDEINNYIPLFQQALVKSLPMICADSDRIKISQGNIPMMGPGYIVEKYSRMGGRVFMRGKPQNDIFAYCLEGMNIKDKNRAVVIGDGFETDIVGGYNSGLATVFVAGGVHSRELRVAFDNDLDIKRIEGLSANFAVYPDYVIPFVK